MKRIHIALLLLAYSVLLAVKIPTMNLPHYWDEAFPYSYAIGFMTENGPGILTTAAPATYTTGHPLLYYFIQASWNMLVGDTMWLQRVLPLLISMAVLWLTFLLGKRLYNENVGGGAALLLACQNVFLANATFQLPEMLLTLFLLTSVYSLYRKRFVAFATSNVLMLFVKEPAVVLLLVIFLFHFFVLLRKESFAKRLRIIWMYAIPIAINLAFYAHQYMVHSWVLFPRHTGFITLTADFFFNQFKRYFAHLFIYSGRNAVFFIGLVASLFLCIKHREFLFKRTETRDAVFLSSITVCFLAFSAFNFYSNRYILCLFPLFMIVASAVVYYLLKKWVWASTTTVISISGVILYIGLTNLKVTDHSLGYARAVIVQKNAVEFCVMQGWQDQQIHTGFLMGKNLTSHYPGYVKEREVFQHVNQVNPAEADIIIVSSNETKLLEQTILADFKLTKRFENDVAWCNIYAKIR